MKKITAFVAALLTAIAFAAAPPTITTELDIHASLELMLGTIVECPAALDVTNLGLVVCATVPDWMTPELIRSANALQFSTYSGWTTWTAWTYTGDWHVTQLTNSDRGDILGLYLLPGNRVFFMASSLND